MIKIIRLDKVCLNAIDVHCRLVRAYLFDQKSTEEEYQIVILYLSYFMKIDNQLNYKS